MTIRGDSTATTIMRTCWQANIGVLAPGNTPERRLRTSASWTTVHAAAHIHHCQTFTIYVFNHNHLADLDGPNSTLGNVR